MNLPQYWARASFSIAEVAELIGVSEVTLRTYLARNPEPDFLGTREGRRVYLSCRDAFYYMLVSELSEFGVPVRSAMHVAARQAAGELPDHDYLVVRAKGGISQFELTDDRPTDAHPALVLPIRALAEVLIDDAAKVYATDAS